MKIPFIINSICIVQNDFGHSSDWLKSTGLAPPTGRFQLEPAGRLHY